MNHKNEDVQKPQSEVYVELLAAKNLSQKGVIFSEVNSLKEECNVVYETHEDILNPGIYSFDLFYEPNINFDDVDPNEKTTESKSGGLILLKLKKPKN